MSETTARPDQSSFRTFLIVWGGQLVSTLGSQLGAFAGGVWLYDTTGSTTMQVRIAPALGFVVDTLSRGA